MIFLYSVIDWISQFWHTKFYFLWLGIHSDWTKDKAFFGKLIPKKLKKDWKFTRALTVHSTAQIITMQYNGT